MSGYRFCRTDDAALLVETYERCRGSHLASEPPLTVDAFKLAAREIGLWASSCMIAVEGDEAVGVLLGAKNAAANAVQRIAVREDHRRRGHGRHLLESLRNKVSILGPRRLTAEVPAAWADACRFFERCGFDVEVRYADFLAADLLPAPSGLAAPLTIEELLESNVLAAAAPVSWENSADVVRRRARGLESLAIASDERIEAHVVYRTTEATEIIRLGFTRAEVLGALLGDLAALRPGPLRVLRAPLGDAGAEALERLGFRREAEFVGYAARF